MGGEERKLQEASSKDSPSHGRQQAAQGRWQATGTSSKGVVELVLFLELSPILSRATVKQGSAQEDVKAELPG